jgi:RNA polymerase sigma-70 factor (ECF subfamily)
MQRQIHKRLQPLQPESADGNAIKEVLAGHLEVFDVLFHRYHQQILVFARNYLRDYELASDIAQHVFLQLYVSLPTLRMDTSLSAWLYRVAQNRCVDELRRRRVIPFSQMEIFEVDEDYSPLASLQDADPLPEELVEQQEKRESISQAIDGLPSKYRMVVLLRYRTQLSFSEVGKILHMPTCTAKTYFYRALPLLRVALASLRK